MIDAEAKKEKLKYFEFNFLNALVFILFTSTLFPSCEEIMTVKSVTEATDFSRDPFGFILSILFYAFFIHMFISGGLKRKRNIKLLLAFFLAAFKFTLDLLAFVWPVGVFTGWEMKLTGTVICFAVSMIMFIYYVMDVKSKDKIGGME